MGKGSAPKPDPRIGEAALLSAQTGQDYLKMMREQADITNAWAAEDRSRQRETFIPLQDEYITRATEWASPERTAAEAAKAGATVRNQAAMAAGTTQRQLAAAGVNPASGRGIETTGRLNLAAGLAEAGARNSTRDTMRGQEMQMLASAVNLGQGLEVNPGTSMGLSSGALSSGFGGAMRGYGQQGDLLNTAYNQQMRSWEARQASAGSFWGGVGTLAGAFFSDENVKKNKKPLKKSARRSIDQMRVEEWDYEDGAGDGGHHVGTYAQDFKKATGLGDGRTINVIDAIGVNMAATKELSEDVRGLTAELAAMKGGKAVAASRAGRGIA